MHSRAPSALGAPHAPIELYARFVRSGGEFRQGLPSLGSKDYGAPRALTLVVFALPEP